jgi:hypothetical protein
MGDAAKYCVNFYTRVKGFIENPGLLHCLSIEGPAEVAAKRMSNHERFV